MLYIQSHCTYCTYCKNCTAHTVHTVHVHTVHTIQYTLYILYILPYILHIWLLSCWVVMNWIAICDLSLVGTFTCCLRCAFSCARTRLLKFYEHRTVSYNNDIFLLFSEVQFKYILPGVRHVLLCQMSNTQKQRPLRLPSLDVEVCWQNTPATGVMKVGC